MNPSKADAIIMFIERLVSMTSECMPESTAAHRHCTIKKEVYEIFVQELNVLRS